MEAGGGEEFVGGDAVAAVEFAVDGGEFVAAGLLAEGEGDGFDGLAELAGLIVGYGLAGGEALLDGGEAAADVGDDDGGLVEAVFGRAQAAVEFDLLFGHAGDGEAEFADLEEGGGGVGTGGGGLEGLGEDVVAFALVADDAFAEVVFDAVGVDAEEPAVEVFEGEADHGAGAGPVAGGVELRCRNDNGVGGFG